MNDVSGLEKQYKALDWKAPMNNEEAIDASCLLTFPYDYAENPAEVVIDTDEFTAVCPWTGLPDQGTLIVKYVPGDSVIELKSLKYYLFSFRDVGIVQEHATSRILNDLVDLCKPRSMTVSLDYNIRGGLHTAVKADYSQES